MEYVSGPDWQKVNKRINKNFSDKIGSQRKGKENGTNQYDEMIGGIGYIEQKRKERKRNKK